MAERKPAKQQKSRAAGKSPTFSAEERAAMRETVRERKAAVTREESEREVVAKIAEMEDSDRAIAERIHSIVADVAPDLAPRTFYGMPAYAKDGKVVCFFKPAAKFKSRYATFGFEEAANLDDGPMWPTSYALTKLTAADEKKIAALVKQAAS
ncbi:MAG TPA: hypothetical protein VID47_02130 [Actinomycetota bacterium]